MNILFLVDTGLSKVCRGGIERSTERCAREMISRGHKALVFSWKREKDMQTTLPQEVFPREKPRNAKENRALFEKTLREERIDVPVVSVIRAVPNSYEARYRMKYSGLSRWWNIATKRWRQKRKYRFNYGCCASTVVLAKGLIPVLEAHLTRGQVAQKKITAIWNFAPTEKISEELPQKKKELLFVGRMSFFEKRPDYLLRVWAKLEKRFPAWSLRFVGDGDYLPALKELAGTLGLERVRFEGFQKPEPYYREASIFCLTSVYESFGNVLVEAAAFGCVPVAFDSFAAARDIIDDGENGRLVPAFDLDAYAETLARLMSDDALRERLAKNALAQIPAKFSPEKIGDMWEALFRKLLAEKGRK